MAPLYKRIELKIYLLFHSKLWGKSIQLDELPEIQVIDHLIIGQNVSINDHVFLQCHGGITIGNNVTLSRNTQILTGGLDLRNYSENAQQRYRSHTGGPVLIDDGVWIAANCVVVGGVHIPKNCVIAAGSVVNKSLSIPNALYGGVPAKFIKKLD